MCALLVMDHGSQLIRQINLKQNDCVSSRSGEWYYRYAILNFLTPNLSLSCHHTYHLVPKCKAIK